MKVYAICTARFKCFVLILCGARNQNHPGEGCLGREGLKSQKESTDLNRNFQREGVGGGKLKREMHCGRGMDIFVGFQHC